MAGTNVVPMPPPERDSYDSPSLVTAPVPESLAVAAATLFGAGLDDARRYAEILCSMGIERGVIGPREAPRMWDRHLLNCAAIAAAIPAGCRLVDVGSGAGLPGIPLALARPDLTVTLLDSLSRRIAFLEEALVLLQLGPRVRSVLARAEEHRVHYDVVTARAVAPLAKLGLWTAGLVSRGGLLVAIRGKQGKAELAAAGSALEQAGWKDGHVMTYGDELPTATTVVVATRA